MRMLRILLLVDLLGQSVLLMIMSVHTLLLTQGKLLTGEIKTSSRRHCSDSDTYANQLHNL